MQLFGGAQASAVLKAALELDLFTAMAAAGEPATAAMLAVERDLDPRGVRILLDALCALGVLERVKAGDDARYALTDVADQHLVRGRPADLSGEGLLLTSDAMFAMLPTMPAAVRQGGTVLPQHAESGELPFWAAFASWTTNFAAAAGAAIAERLGIPAAGPVSILDLGCGSGMVGYTIAVLAPEVRITSLDWPSVLEVARRNAQAFGLADRVSFVAGDLLDVEPDGTFDVIVLSHLLQHFDEEKCQRILERAVRHLAPGGRLVVHDFVRTDAPPATEPDAHLFATVMLVFTRSGEVHSLETYRRLFATVGLGEPEVGPAGMAPTSLLVGVRP
jgi:ubiquinone/menaquinone biosynthesis C-methylase UbiE